jgi:hypothetical protein
MLIFTFIAFKTVTFVESGEGLDLCFEAGCCEAFGDSLIDYELAGVWYDWEDWILLMTWVGKGWALRKKWHPDVVQGHCTIWLSLQRPLAARSRGPGSKRKAGW